jgi:SDR family mycofactocin-dependent oxidoreductase
VGRLDAKVAIVTGAARGQGRSHVERLAAEGAHIVALDICRDFDETDYPSAESSELEATADIARRYGSQVMTGEGDIRDQAWLDEVVSQCVSKFGRLDIVVANAGINGGGRSWDISDEEWEAVVSVNLTGTWRTIKAAVPSMIEARNGGSIIIVNSNAGLAAAPYLSHYASAKHGTTGLMKTLAVELGRHWIRVNSVHPCGVSTPMTQTTKLQEALLDHPEASSYYVNALPVRTIEPVDVSNAVLWLASDEARFVTGVALPVDAGRVAILEL